MAISNEQKIDYLWKKIGYGVSKTDTNSVKQAVNESIASPLLIRGDNIWVKASEITDVFPSSNTSYITIYDDTGGGSATVETTADTTATSNRTWKTNLTNWIPAEFGAAYQVKVYTASSGAANPQSSGTRLFAAGSGNNDEWFFDYQSGVLHFIGTNLPSSVAGNKIFISGARYTGPLGTSSIGLDSDQVLNLIDTEEQDSADIEALVSGLVRKSSEDLTTTSTNQIIDSFDKNDFRTAKYIVQVEHDSDSKYHSTELLLTHNGSDVYFTEYATIASDSDLGTFSANLSSDTITLVFTPSYTNTSVKTRRINIES